MNEDLLKFYNTLKQGYPSLVADMTPDEFIASVGDRGKFIQFLDILPQAVPDIYKDIDKQGVLDSVYPIRKQPARASTVPAPIVSEGASKTDPFNLIPEVEDVEDSSLFGQLGKEADAISNQIISQEQAKRKVQRDSEFVVGAPNLSLTDNIPAEEEKVIKAKTNYEVLLGSGLQVDQVTPKEIFQFVNPDDSADAYENINTLERDFGKGLDKDGKINPYAIARPVGLNPFTIVDIPNLATRPDVKMTPDEILKAKSIEGLNNEELLKVKKYVSEHKLLRAAQERKELELYQQWVSDTQGLQIPEEVFQANDTLEAIGQKKQTGQLSQEDVVAAEQAIEIINSQDEKVKGHINTIPKGYENAEARRAEIEQDYPELKIVDKLNQSIQKSYDDFYNNLGERTSPAAIKSLLNVAKMGAEVLPTLSNAIGSTYDSVAGGFFGNEDAKANTIRRANAFVQPGTLRDASAQQRSILERTADFEYNGVKYELGFSDDGKVVAIYDQYGAPASLDENAQEEILDKGAALFGESKKRLNNSSAFNAVTDGLRDLAVTLILSKGVGSAIGGSSGFATRLREGIPVMGQYLGRISEEGIKQGLTPEEAFTYGGLQAGMEASTEMLFPFVGTLTGSATRNMAKVMKRIGASPEELKKMSRETFFDLVIKGPLGEGVEEAAAAVLNPVVNQAVNKLEEENLDITPADWEDIATSAALGAVIGFIPGAIGGITQSRRVATDQFLAESIYSAANNLEKVKELAKGNTRQEEIVRMLESTLSQTRDVLESEATEADKIKAVAQKFDQIKREADASAALGSYSHKNIQNDADNLEQTYNKTAASILNPDTGESSEGETDQGTEELPVTPKKAEASVKVFSDFDNTLYNPRTGQLTPLGVEMKAKIEAGEDITILTNREDTPENRELIASQLGISSDKIKLGLSPEGKAAELTEGSVFYDDNPNNVAAARQRGNVEVVDTGDKTANPLQDVESTAKALNIADPDMTKLGNLWDYKTATILAEDYHKAKADGSNPELVKAVEDLLGVQESSQESTTETGDVDQKKADIEKRRQEELDKRIPERAEIWEDENGDYYQISYFKDGRNNIAVVDNIKGDNPVISDRNIEPEGYLPGFKKVSDSPVRGNIEKFTSKINAKYDAELAAINRQQSDSAAETQIQEPIVAEPQRTVTPVKKGELQLGDTVEYEGEDWIVDRINKNDYRLKRFTGVGRQLAYADEVPVSDLKKVNLSNVKIGDKVALDTKQDLVKTLQDTFKLPKRKAEAVAKAADIILGSISKTPEARRLGHTKEKLYEMLDFRIPTEREYDEFLKEARRRNVGPTSQEVGGEVRGALVIQDAQYIIYAITNPNVSTPLHELAHVFERYLTDAQRLAVIEAAGTGQWTDGTSEYFASGFEKWLRDGEAPTGLEELFEDFKQWLTDIYRGLRDLDLQLTPEVINIYRQMLGAEASELLTPKEKVLAETSNKWFFQQNTNNTQFQITGNDTQGRVPLRTEVDSTARTSEESNQGGDSSEENLLQNQERVETSETIGRTLRDFPPSGENRPSTNLGLSEGEADLGSVQSGSALDGENTGTFTTRDGKPIGFNYDTDQVARERFDLSNLKKIGEGSDRVVFDLGNQVLKVAKTPRGLEQNIYEGDSFLFMQGITPEVFERGLNYVVADKLAKARSANVIPTFDVETGQETGTSTFGKMIKELSQYSQKEFDNRSGELQDALNKYGFGDVLNYDLLWGDFKAARNWGYKEGKAYHVDGGTFGGTEMLTSRPTGGSVYDPKYGKMVKSNPLSDEEFRDIYNRSRAAKKQFGDTDKFTKFQISSSPISEETQIVNGFYSPIEKTLLETKQEVRPAKQWIEIFGKGDEVVFTGLRDFLQSKNPTDKVNKSEILDFIRRNRIQLVEVVKGEGRGKTAREKMEDAKTRLQSLGYVYKINTNGDGYLYSKKEYDEQDDPTPLAYNKEGFSVLPKEVQDLVNVVNEQDEFINGVGYEDRETQYQGYTLPGKKEGYREVLITLPVEGDIGKEATRKFYDKAREKDEYASKKVPRKEGEDFLVYTQRVEDKLIDDDKYSLLKEDVRLLSEEMDRATSRNGELFNSQHFSEPNILAHLRMDIRQDVDGNKVLFLEEIQSDWGEKGRDSGFASSRDKAVYKLAKEVYHIRRLVSMGDLTKEEANRMLKNAKDNYTDENITEDEIRDTIEKYGDFTRDNSFGVPPAPFVMDTNKWTKLALKYAMQHAVREGASKIAWTTGEQQNDRYSLSNVISSIFVDDPSFDAYPHLEEGYRHVDLFGPTTTTSLVVAKDGRIEDVTNHRLDVKDKQLSEVIGKELADKVMSAPAKTEFRDKDIEVGGEGMKGFYGSPKEGKLGIVGGVAKSLFGEVKTTEIETGDTTQNILESQLKERAENEAAEGDIGASYLLRNVARARTVTSAQKALDRMRSDNLAKYGVTNKSFDIAQRAIDEFSKSKTLTQHSVDVTPKIRAEVLKGVPQFQQDSPKRTKREILQRIIDNRELPEGVTPREVYDFNRANFEAYNISFKDFERALKGEIVETLEHSFEDVKVLKSDDLKTVFNSADTLRELNIPFHPQYDKPLDPRDEAQLQFEVGSVVITGKQYAQKAIDIYGTNPLDWIPQLVAYANKSDILKRNIILTYLVDYVRYETPEYIDPQLILFVDLEWRKAGSLTSEAFNSRRALRKLHEFRNERMIDDSQLLAKFKKDMDALTQLIETADDSDLHKFEVIQETTEQIKESVKPKPTKQVRGKAKSAVVSKRGVSNRDAIKVRILEKQAILKVKCK